MMESPDPESLELSTAQQGESDGRSSLVTEPGESARYDQQSLEFEGRWNRLVSSTNWEKGRIISQWRQTLRDEGAAPAVYSDEAWSRRVPAVTGQHVGRLRRVWERFGTVHDTYAGLFWSHFQVAIDWADAELWLEGATQNGWSVARMRQARVDALGATADEALPTEPLPTAEVDEDFVDPALTSGSSARAAHGDVGSRQKNDDESANDDVDEGRPDVATADQDDGASSLHDGGDQAPWEETQVVDPERGPLFADLAPLPEDLAEPCEQLKLAIVRHRQADWAEVSPDDVLQMLSALAALVRA